MRFEASRTFKVNGAHMTIMCTSRASQEAANEAADVVKCRVKNNEPVLGLSVKLKSTGESVGHIISVDRSQLDPDIYTGKGPCLTYRWSELEYRPNQEWADE